MPFVPKARELCKGLGLEIGALHTPFELDATVLYLDRASQRELKEIYAKDKRRDAIVPVTLVAKAIPYDFLADSAFDFVASSHALEHFPNPGLALEEWVRVVKPGGIIYTIIPNRDRTFDKSREVTAVSVLMDAYASREPTAPLAQYQDFYRNKRIPENAARRSESEVIASWEMQDSIHVYTYTPDSVKEFASGLSEVLPVELVWVEAEGINIHFALRVLDKG